MVEGHSFTIPVGVGPFAVAYATSNHNIYVANVISGTVSVISSTTNTVSKTILVGNGPVDIVYVPTNNHIYVSNFYSNDVYVIDANRNVVIKSLPVGRAPSGNTYNPSNNHVYVANLGDNTVSVIDTSTDTIMTPISLVPGPNFPSSTSSDSPSGLSYNPAVNGIYMTHFLYVPVFNDYYSVGIINGATDLYVNDILTQHNPPPTQRIERPNNIAFNPFNNGIYVTNLLTITVIDGVINKKITDIAVVPTSISGWGLRGIIYNPTNHNMYVCSAEDGKVYTISPQNSVISSTAVGNTPLDLVYNPSNNHLYVTTFDGIKVIHP